MEPEGIQDTSDVHPGGSRDERSGTSDNLGVDDLEPEGIQDTSDVQPGGSRHERSGTADNLGVDDVEPEGIQDTADVHPWRSRVNHGPPFGPRHSSLIHQMRNQPLPTPYPGLYKKYQWLILGLYLLMVPLPFHTKRWKLVVSMVK